ncbi:trafficking protein particle complex subunit 5-like [Condylostylus longicornis]|uniref:trafficking protein particle complex subunit 5-like n=1 Tax=Condylostylus longicornis TaxID=2530218 RepID=UPI00244DC205|nr:trafficking protein particle complex subunit 5-like [Condylostylus longicornis]
MLYYGDSKKTAKSTGGKPSLSSTASPRSLGDLKQPPAARQGILDRPLVRPKQEVSLSFTAFLFAEAVRYSLAGVQQSHQLEERLHELGVRVGWKVLELLSFREKHGRRDTRLLSILTFVSQNCWRYLFGHTGELLKGQEHDNEYMISDRNLILIKYINVPKDIGHVSCASYVAGIVEGILCCAEFPAEVTAHTVEEGPATTSTTILIRFLAEVIARERRLAG